MLQRSYWKGCAPQEWVCFKRACDVFTGTLHISAKSARHRLLSQTISHSSCDAAQPLEGYEPQEWVCFERALVVRDIFTGGVRTFLSKADAQAFRDNLYAQYGEHPFPDLGAS